MKTTNRPTFRKFIHAAKSHFCLSKSFRQYAAVYMMRNISPTEAMEMVKNGPEVWHNDLTYELVNTLGAAAALAEWEVNPHKYPGLRFLVSYRSMAFPAKGADYHNYAILQVDYKTLG